MVAVLRERLQSIVGAALRAVSAEALMAHRLAALRDTRDLRDLRAASDAGRLVLIAAGKPSIAMVRGLIEAGLVPSRGLIATTAAHANTPAAAVAGDDVRPAVDVLRVFHAGHPVPTPESVAAGRAALALARAATPDDRLVVLLSGGASALLAAPADGLTLDDKMRATRALLGAGAAIHELNAVRKHLSAIKGGRLAAAASCPVYTFALSDVISPVDDDPGVIGSGPTVADASTFVDALAAIDRLGVRASLPPAVLSLLEAGAAAAATAHAAADPARSAAAGASAADAAGAGADASHAAGALAESPKPGDPRLARASYTSIGSRRDAMAAARAEAERLGCAVFVIDEAVSGEAREAAPRLLARARALALSPSRARDDARIPACVIASGETTVRVRGTGRGGRNQELALALVDLLADSAVVPTVAASVGTDGIDGPTDAAGAIVDTTTRDRARALGRAELRAFLDDNDSYAFFDPLGDLIRTGPTDTNVGDLLIVLFGGTDPSA